MAAHIFKGQGTYGCIYEPAFRCKIRDPNGGERVSKIFKTHKEAIEFYEKLLK